MYKKQFQGKLPAGEYYHLVVHGGYGDFSWIYSKLCNLPLPLFIDVTSEHPYRPNRVGDFLDTLPKIIGWRYINETFGGKGKMWNVASNDPACAYGVKWKDLDIKPNVPTRLECNLWLNTGNKLEDWLPDLPTNYHYEADIEEPTNPPEIKKPAIGLHFAGWKDIPDSLWIEATKLLEKKAHVYLISAPYDARTKGLLAKLSCLSERVIPFVGKSWNDVWYLLKRLDYLVGHASGLTIIGNVLSIPGAVVNPKSVPLLKNTWNDPNFKRQAQISSNEEFLAVASKIASSLPAIALPEYKSPYIADELKSSLISRAGLKTETNVEDCLAALGRFRKPRKLLLAEPSDSLCDLVEAATASTAVSAIQVLLTNQSRDVLEKLYIKTNKAAQKPFVYSYTGNPEDNSLYAKARLAAPFDLAVVDGSFLTSDQVYNYMTVANALLKKGGGMLVVTKLLRDDVKKAYEDFCVSKGKPQSVAEIADHWGLWFN